MALEVKKQLTAYRLPLTAGAVCPAAARPSLFGSD